MKKYRMIILPVHCSKCFSEYINSFLEKFNGETIGIVNMQTSFDDSYRYVHICYWIKTEHLHLNDYINYIESDENFPLIKYRTLKWN